MKEYETIVAAMTSKPKPKIPDRELVVHPDLEKRLAELEQNVTKKTEPKNASVLFVETADLAAQIAQLTAKIDKFNVKNDELYNLEFEVLTKLNNKLGPTDKSNMQQYITTAQLEREILFKFKQELDQL